MNLLSPIYKFKITRCIQRANSKYNARLYHSFPDPSEVPVISQHKSDSVKTLDKSGKDFVVSPDFSLIKAFPGVPPNSGSKNSPAPKTISTILSNGLTVATQDLPGFMSSFALFVGSGSSFEKVSDSTVGATHAIELAAFRSSTNRTHLEIVSRMEELGGMMQCVSTRENIMYCVDVLRSNTEEAMDIFADSILNAQYLQEEIDECKMIMELQQTELPAEIFSRDSLQMAGYQGQPLGNPHFCPKDIIPTIDASLLRRFKSKHFVGENCIISASGVDHDSFVKIVERKFKSLPSIGSDNFLSLKKDRAVSTFTGGINMNQRELKEPFIKICLGFEIGGWMDDTLVAACVLQTLLGGGSSFSAGGPGKGMYTRLYTQLLNRHHWIESAEAFISLHGESGIFGIDGACPADYAPHMIRTIIDQLSKLAVEPVSDEELNRAKNMLRSMMMMQLESRLVICEDIGRQFASYGKREAPHEVSLKIEAITKKDLMDVARRMMKSKPAVGCVGHDLSHVPAYEMLENFAKMYWEDLQKKNNTFV